MSTSDKLSQYELRSNAVNVKKILNNIDRINRDMSSVQSLKSTQSQKFRDVLTKSKNKLIVEIEKVHLKHKHKIIKKMKDKSSDVMNAKLRILRSDKSKTEKDEAILQLNMKFDMFLLQTVNEAQKHPFLKGNPRIIQEINDVRMKLSPKSPLKRTATSRRPVTSRGTRGESARGKGSIKKGNKKFQKLSKKKNKNKNTNKKRKIELFN